VTFVPSSRTTLWKTKKQYRNIFYDCTPYPTNPRDYSLTIFFNVVRDYSLPASSTLGWTCSATSTHKTKEFFCFLFYHFSFFLFFHHSQNFFGLRIFTPGNSPVSSPWRSSDYSAIWSLTRAPRIWKMSWIVDWPPPWKSAKCTTLRVTLRDGSCQTTLLVVVPDADHTELWARGPSGKATRLCIGQ